ncbi:hypothetical protein LDO31_04015 [Luteimonas sp. XNQY3]|nr:hypothetical protein [Luteimonas sp. XNQY3]MCD9005414.1 hypothetical protein [Luteimonas sp. XNQY3]
MCPKPTESAHNPDQARQADHVAVNDRKAARGDEYAHDNNRSAEGNDASLTAGPAFERRVHADGRVAAVPPPTNDAEGGDASKASKVRKTKDA